MGSIRRYCGIALHAPVPVPESVLIQVGQTVTEDRARPRKKSRRNFERVAGIGE